MDVGFRVFQRRIIEGVVLTGMGGGNLCTFAQGACLQW